MLRCPSLPSSDDPGRRSLGRTTGPSKAWLEPTGLGHHAGMQPWKQEGQIWSGVALHTWRLLKDYEELTERWPAERRHEVTLWLCCLQNLLTVCTELVESLHKHKSLVIRTLDNAVAELLAHPQVQYFHTQSGCFSDRRNAASTSKFLKNLRNALSHPRTTQSDAWTTGYETDENESGLIHEVTFINSPDVTSLGQPHRQRLKEDPSWDVSRAGYMTMIIPTHRLGIFVEEVALALAQPALGNWDEVPPVIPQRSPALP